jgi:ferredoxin
MMDLRLPLDYREAARLWDISDPEFAFSVHATVGGIPGYRSLIPRTPDGMEDFDDWVVDNLLTTDIGVFTHTEVDYDPGVAVAAVDYSTGVGSGWQWQRQQCPAVAVWVGDVGDGRTALGAGAVTWQGGPGVGRPAVFRACAWPPISPKSLSSMSVSSTASMIFRSPGNPGLQRGLMKITVDQDKCIGSGQCVVAAGEVFDQRDSDGLVVLLEPNPPAESIEDVRQAAAVCPALAITVEE